MKSKPIEKQAIDLMLAVVAATTNQRLYPPTSSLVVNTKNRLTGIVKTALEQVGEIIFAEAEKNLLIQGEPLSEKELAKSQINAFLRMMLDYGIRSVSFQRGVDEQEITEFIKIFSRTPQEVEAEGGVSKIVADARFTYIKIDEKVYVEQDSDHRMVSSMKLSDDDIVRFILGDKGFSEEAMEQVREMVKDAEWISKVFQAGVKQVIKETENFIADELSDRFGEMINGLSRVSKLGRGDVSRTILGSLTEMENASAVTLLSQNLNTVFGQNTFQNFVEDLDDDAFHRLLSRIKDLTVSISDDDSRSEHHVKAMHRVFQLMTSSKKAAGLFTLDQLQALKNEVAMTPEERLAKGMDKTIEMLMAKGNMASVMTLIERLGKMLKNRDPKVRINAVRMMLKVDKRLEAEEQNDDRLPILQKLAEWLGFETVMSPEYEQITDQMEQMVRHLIERDRPRDAELLLDAYYRIYTGRLPREKEMRAPAGKMLRNLATEDLLALLISETRADGTKKQSDGIPALTMLGTVSIERLLNRLHHTQNRLERNRMIQALTAIGRPAAKPIVERLFQKGPWYYLRNLILVLGRIGTDSHLKVLSDMLAEDDSRIQREAVFAIQNIAGNNAGEILMKYLYSVDDDVKELIIVGLGAVKYQPAVAELAAMLEEKSLGKTRKARDDIRIKICEALGRIGDKEALPALKKIIRSKGFMAIKAHDPFVRAAAADAVAKLKQGDA
jgi:HEAT repeat protein